MSNLTRELEQQGYSVLPHLLDAAWIEKLKREAQRFAAEQGYSLSVQLQMVHKSAIIRDFVTTGPQIAAAIDALGPNVCFTHQQYITKHPDGKARTDVPWHQDNGYGRLEPPEDLTIWITLDDCDGDNGCLWVLPGSHRGGLVDHSRKGGLMSADVGESGVPLPMKAGDAVAFGSLLLHRSLPNTTNKTRVAMYVRYCTPHVTMVTEGNKPVLDDPYSWMVAGEA